MILGVVCRLTLFDSLQRPTFVAFVLDNLYPYTELFKFITCNIYFSVVSRFKNLHRNIGLTICFVLLVHTAVTHDKRSDGG